MGLIWKLTDFGKAHRGLPGMPWRDLTDEEMKAAIARHPGIQDHGYFTRVEVEETAPSSSTRRPKAVLEDEADER